MTGFARARLACSLAILGAALCLLPAGPAFAGGFGSRSSASRFAGKNLLARPNPWGRASPSQRLQEFTERRRFAARVALLNTSRDAERRTAELLLRQRGTRASLERYRRRVRREDDQDHLRLRSAASRLSVVRAPADADGWWHSLGPATRASFVRSGLDLRRLRRGAEREQRLADVERAIEGRRPQGFEVLDRPELP